MHSDKHGPLKLQITTSIKNAMKIAVLFCVIDYVSRLAKAIVLPKRRRTSR